MSAFEKIRAAQDELSEAYRYDSALEMQGAMVQATLAVALAVVELTAAIYEVRK